MSLGSASYRDPGTYIQQRMQPGSVSVSADRALCIVGVAPRTRRTTDEVIIRGKVYDETLTVASGVPHTATLASPSDRSRNTAILYRNDQALGLGDWSFNPATITGTALGGTTIANTNYPYFTISMDGKAPVRLVVSTLGGTTPIATVVSELNVALAAVPAYGSAYNSVFSLTGSGVTTAVVITSPISTSASDIKILLSLEIPVTGLDCAYLLSPVGALAWNPTATVGVQAATTITVNSTVYSASDVYTIEYVSINTVTDPLVNAASATPLSQLIRTGSFPGGSNYLYNTDYLATGNTVDWWHPGTLGWAPATIVGGAGTFNLVVSTNDEIRISINGRAAVTITLTAGGARTAAQVVAEINTALSVTYATTYGPAFAHVATVASTFVTLTAPQAFENYPVEHGEASVISLFQTTNTAITTIFGLTLTTSLVHEHKGVGNRPAFGSVYYSTYDYTRASTDYTNPTRVYSTDEMYRFTSPLTISNYPSNDLAVAGEIAFANGVSSLYLVPVNDVTVPGTPTQNQINAAIDICKNSTVITDVVVMDTAVATHSYLMNHVSTMSSMFEKKYRRGWYGMARGTSVGDPDTADTLVYRASRTLQPGTTSPGRGRHILCAPCSISRTLTLEDSREVTVDLDGTYLAVADAAVFVSLPSPADAILGKMITGFLTDSTFETYLQAERYVLAGNGVNVNTLDAGNIVMLDPLTTEAGGGKVIEFEEPSSSAQKDAVTRSIETILDRNVKGIVPDDLADFIVDVKTWVALAIKAQINAGSVAPFRNSDGTTRDIDLMVDIKAFQDATDPRSFTFQYWFNLKYVAKRFFGEYSVDNPFFAG